MATAKDALQRLCDPVHEVSSHYLIGRDGHVFRLVAEDKRAWHAGAGQWGGAGDVNSRSIGIELDNDGASAFAAPLMASLERLLADILARCSIPPMRVIGHQDMAPGRKSDPGQHFDWGRLAGAGLAVWPADDSRELPVDALQFAQSLRSFGYPELSGDVSFEALHQAFRARFRAGLCGPLDGRDVAMAHELARRFPFDRRQSGA